VSFGAANKFSVQHIGKFEVRGKLAATGYFVQSVGSYKVIADIGVIFAFV
jgi:hypothetical protein